MMFATGYIDKLIVKINPNSKLCPDGTCKSSCAAIQELRSTSGKCVDPEKVCCIPNTRKESPECSGRSQGELCGTMMICDENKFCVTRCEYCSRFPSDKSCNITSGLMGKYVAQLDSEFSCGCTERDCVSLDDSKLGTCVKGFCPNVGDIASIDHMCCKTPYN
jgi:hypothetical protein